MNLSVFASAITTDIIKKTPRYRFLLGVLVAIIFSLSFTVRLLPVPWIDRAVFVTVGEYLRSGSRLYVDIYDNKDPFFFYAVAAQRVLGPFGEYLFELGMLAIAAFSTYRIANTIGHANTPHKKLLLLAVPLLLTGHFWQPGLTNLPGTALCLCAISLFLKNKPILSGSCMALVALTKLVVLPIPAVFCLTYEVVLWKQRASYRRLFSITSGFTVIFGMAMLLLLTRGELVGYLQAQQNNFFYSQGILVNNSSFLSAFISHLRTIFIGYSAKAIVLSSFILSMTVIGYIATRPTVEPKTKALFVSTMSTGVVSIGILGLTAIWDHHLQIIYCSQVLILLCFSVVVRAKQTVVNILYRVAIVVFAVLLSGSTSWQQYNGTSMSTLSKISYLAQPSYEIKAFRSLYPQGTGFARLGENKQLVAHGEAEDNLLCPEFAQYPFYGTERFQSILNCAKTAPTLIVDYSFVPIDELPDWWPIDSQKELIVAGWNEFVAAGESLIEANYTCQEIEGVRVCDAIVTEIP